MFRTLGSSREEAVSAIVQSETEAVGDSTSVEREADASSGRLGRCNVNIDLCFLKDFGATSFVGEDGERSGDIGEATDGEVNDGDILALDMQSAEEGAGAQGAFMQMQMVEQQVS